MSQLGKALIAVGFLIVLIGMVLTFLPSSRIGRLPGDLTIRRKLDDLPADRDLGSHHIGFESNPVALSSLEKMRRGPIRTRKT